MEASFRPKIAMVEALISFDVTSFIHGRSLSGGGIRIASGSFSAFT